MFDVIIPKGMLIQNHTKVPGMSNLLDWAIIDVSSKFYAKQKQPGCKKSARPIRSHNGYKRPKSLISSKAKKLNILLRILLLE